MTKAIIKRTFLQLIAVLLVSMVSVSCAAPEQKLSNMRNEQADGWRYWSDESKVARVQAIVTSKNPKKEELEFAKEVCQDIYSGGGSFAQIWAPFTLGILNAGLEFPAETQNYSEALKWLTVSANRGHAHSKYSLGMLLKNGDYKGAHPPDIAKAEFWLLAAAKQDFILSYRMLGVVYIDQKDFKNAVLWTHKGALAGDRDAQYNYAALLANGYGIPKNLERAYYWALIARDNMSDSKLSEENLGVIISGLQQSLTKQQTDAIEIRVKRRSSQDSYWD